MEIVYLMLGGNIGDRENFLRRSIDMLRRDAGRIVAMSSIYESEPWGFDDNHLFFNQVVVVETNLTPASLLECTQQIEQNMGRQRNTDGYQSRTMDIDILLYGNWVVNLPELVIPHPLIPERMFVLQPLAELAPDMTHPVLHHTITYLMKHCGDTKQVKKLNI